MSHQPWNQGGDNKMGGQMQMPMSMPQGGSQPFNPANVNAPAFNANASSTFTPTQNFQAQNSNPFTNVPASWNLDRPQNQMPNYSKFQA